MGFNVEDSDRGVGVYKSAAEDNSCSVGGPGRVPLWLEVFGYQFARRSPIDRNRLQIRLLGGRKGIEKDLLAIG